VSAPRCLVIGAGRIAGGFVAPLLRAAGWDVVLASRNPAVLRAIDEGGGVWLRTGDPPIERWIGGVGAIALDATDLPRIVATADLLATAVGPTQLPAVGRMLGPLLQERLASSRSSVNVVTFENHRRGSELLASGLIEASASLAGQIGRRLGIGGAAVWRAVSNRVVANDGVRFDADDVEECYADAISFVPGAAPLDGAVPGIELVRSFDDRMVEKLWTFNAGHAAAAYLGWHAGCATVDEAMADPEIRAAAASVVAEAQQAFQAYLTMRPGSSPLPSRSLDSILDRYADPVLRDPVIRVAREPRRKLAAGDRLIGPAIAGMAAGLRPAALAAASAAALAYDERTDPQAADLQRELELLGPAEVLAAVSMLDPSDELARLICNSYQDCAVRRVAP